MVIIHKVWFDLSNGTFSAAVAIIAKMKIMVMVGIITRLQMPSITASIFFYSGDNSKAYKWRWN